MASGRNPSMLRMMTRWIAGSGVDVFVGDDVGSTIFVGDRVAVSVAVDSGVGFGLAKLQASRKNRSKMGEIGKCLVFISNR